MKPGVRYLAIAGAMGGGGVVVSVSSVHEDWPMPGNVAYCVSKGGMRMLTRTAGVELGPHGVRVVNVGPGAPYLGPPDHRVRGRRHHAGERRTVSGPQGPIEPELRAERPIDPNVRVGHVHLRTADIDRVRDFYVGILGFDVVHEARGVPGWGTTGDILFVSAGGYHHHLGFNTWKSADGPPQPDGVTGLHHVALNFSSQAELAEAVGRLVDAGVPLRQLTDHGTHLAVYLSDPDS